MFDGVCCTWLPIALKKDQVLSHERPLVDTRLSLTRVGDHKRPSCDLTISFLVQIASLKHPAFITSVGSKLSGRPRSGSPCEAPPISGWIRAGVSMACLE